VSKRKLICNLDAKDSNQIQMATRVAKHSLKTKTKAENKKRLLAQPQTIIEQTNSKDLLHQSLTLQVIGSGLWAGWENA
jgi:hypothetical protein